MKNIITVCIRHPVTVIMALSAVMMGGIISALNLPIDYLPEIISPHLSIETKYPGMGAEDIRAIITIPVEDAVSPVKGLERIKSVSRDGESIIMLDFRWGVNPASAAALVREAVDAVYPNLPEGVIKPVVLSGDRSEVHAVISVSSRTGNAVTERDFCEYELKARLRRIDGIGSVILSGGGKNEIKVEIDVRRAMRQGLSTIQLAQILAYDTAEIPAGSAREGETELVVISSGEPENIEELSQIIIAGDSKPLYLNNIASLREAPEKKKSLFIYDSKEQTALEIYRRPGADPIRLSGDIKKTVKEASDYFARDMEIQIVYDASPSIMNSLRDLAVSMLLGAVAVTIVLFLFIRSARYSVLAAISLPVSAASALLVLSAFGKSLNSMSLSGMALGIGLVSDTSLVTLDVLCRKFSQCAARPKAETIGSVTASLSNSSFSGTATTVVVFVPVLFLPGPLGALFGDLSISLVASVITGWGYAQFALPVLFYLFFQLNKITHTQFRLDKFYRRTLCAAMRKQKYPVAAVLSLGIAGFTLLLGRPATFISSGGSDEIILKINYPTGTRLESVANECINIINRLEKLSFIENVFCKAGSEDEDVVRRADSSYRKETVEFHCFVKPGSGRDSMPASIRKEIEGMNVKDGYVVEYPQDKTERLLGLSPVSTLAVRENGGNKRSDLEDAALRNVEKIKKAASPALITANIKPIEKKTEIRLVPFRDVSALTGITTMQIAQAASSVSDGVLAGRLEIEGRPINIRVLGESADDKKPSKLRLEEIPVTQNNDSPVFLGSVAEIKRMEAPQSLVRLDRSDVLYIELASSAAPKNHLPKLMDEFISNEKNISRIDDSVFSRYKISIIITLILVIVLLYMTMAAQFESFALPLVFMLIIPFSIAGAGPVLALTGSALDSGSVLAIIVLLGLVVNNGIILYETLEQKITNGARHAHAVYSAAVERFHPILASSITSIIVLFPLLANSQGATQKSMAAAMIGGCTAALLLTLLLMPQVYLLFMKIKAGRAR
jgi:multidrug efflux pump subunit AcrB